MTQQSTGVVPNTYVMESGEEGLRLESKTDPVLTERLLRQCGLEPGMSALDAGAGTAAVARVMARMVGPRGHVVGVDRSEERLGQGAKLAQGLANLSLSTADLEETVPPGGPFDFVWCRFVIEYLQDPDRALSNLVSATRVGGKVVLAELDGHATFHHPCDPMVARGLEAVLAELNGRFDPYAGRKLFHRLRLAGLDNIRVHVEPYHLYAGTAPPEAMANWEQKVRTIRSAGVKALGSETAYDQWSTAFLDMLRDPDAFTYSVLIVAEGVRLE